MSGPAHYREAERLLHQACWQDDNGEAYFTEEAGCDLAAAQVHATLALAAATAYPAVSDYWGEENLETRRDWADVAS